MEQRWEKLSPEDRKQMYGDNFLFYGSRVLNEVWIDYEIIDIEKTVENEENFTKKTPKNEKNQ